MEFNLQQTIRSLRNQLLTNCDWTQLMDAPLTTQQKNEWSAYRQILRDLPETQNIEQMVSADQVNWPEQPE